MKLVFVGDLAFILMLVVMFLSAATKPNGPPPTTGTTGTQLLGGFERRTAIMNYGRKRFECGMINASGIFHVVERGAASCPNLQIGVLASDRRVKSAITLVEMFIGARPCVTAPIVSADFDTQAKPNGELLELSSR